MSRNDLTPVLVLVLALFALPSGAGEPDWVGAIVCKSCHGPGQDNDPFTVWSVSKHSRTWVQLGTGYVQMIDPEAKGLVPEGFGGSILREANRLGIDRDCSVCHTTAAGTESDARAETFHIEDGVQCEACHGPGGAHVRWMEANGTGDRPESAVMAISTFEDCLSACHREKPTHEPFIGTEFSIEKAWSKIAH